MEYNTTKNKKLVLNKENKIFKYKTNQIIKWIAKMRVK
jgi:hypothetical protein